MNQNPITTVRLSGQLGRRFGKIHRFYIDTPAEAVRALCSQVKGFEAYMRDPARKTLYKVFANDSQVDIEHEFHLPRTLREVRIAPVIQGAKSGLFQVLIGAALIAAAFLITPAGASVLAGVQGGVFGMGLSLVLGGVAAMLSAQPKLDLGDATSNTPNSGFSVTNRNIQSGIPVPLVYGRAIVPGTAISAGIFASDTNG